MPVDEPGCHNVTLSVYLFVAPSVDLPDSDDEAVFHSHVRMERDSAATVYDSPVADHHVKGHGFSLAARCSSASQTNET
jgi:hypothetical protein